MTVKRITKAYWQLIKSLQTILLVITGIAGYMSGKNPASDWKEFITVIITLFLTIAGTTVFNMIWDRDIDSIMMRTCRRPLPAGLIEIPHALGFGITILSIGLIWGFSISILYGVILFAGFFFDFVVYTLWLKRRSPWSIVWGGLSGAMPILAGRSLAIGTIDEIGIILSLGILLWIPVHILTFAIKYYHDYEKAKIPTFAHTLGIEKTRLLIAFSAVLSAIAFVLAAKKLNIPVTYLILLIILGLMLITLAIIFIFKPNDKINFLLFKSASLFMLLSNIFIAVGNL